MEGCAHAENAMAFEKPSELLAEYITENIINSPETIAKMSGLCALLVEFLHQQGVVVDSHRTCLMKARIIRQFGNQLAFIVRIREM